MASVKELLVLRIFGLEVIMVTKLSWMYVSRRCTVPIYGEVFAYELFRFIDIKHWKTDSMAIVCRTHEVQQIRYRPRKYTPEPEASARYV